MTSPSDLNSKPKLSTLALLSFIFSFLSLCLSIIAAIPAIILGIMAIYKINRDPNRLSGLGFAIAGISVSCVFTVFSALLISILLPSLGRARELANRSACAANLRVISTSMCVYANENNDVFPLVAPPRSLFTYSSDLNISTGKNRNAEALVEMAGSSVAGNATAPLWMLTVTQQTNPKNYLCKSDPCTDNASFASLTDASGTFYANFQKNNQLSYSIAYPWARDSLNPSKLTSSRVWRNSMDSSQPILSDMAPLDGTGTPPRNTASASRAMTGSAVRAVNSFNHNGEGQNVAFADAHVEWVRSPNVGQSMDNIFTSGGIAGGLGTAPSPGRVTSILSDDAPHDTVMIPLRDGNSGEIR